ncbi:hypothetical protein EYZ11_009024 [Aspergillus tanneri]|uniref:Uncharacterized protein n=1 Tax=Aspergillus tanneri TaxID=1220188 RepID=A0A4S3J923_9EURO|nr:hypothetical protein EYZ11_009024 [Aspergillus tanneri]
MAMDIVNRRGMDDGYLDCGEGIERIRYLHSMAEHRFRIDSHSD